MADKDLKEERQLAARYNIYKKGYQMILEMEMPGVTKTDLDVQVTGDHLIVKGGKNTGIQGGEYRVHEIKEGVYRNMFTLDDTIDKNKIEATVKNGIVSITLDIRESEKSKKIEIVSK